MVAVDVAAATNMVLTNSAASHVAVERNASPDFNIFSLLRDVANSGDERPSSAAPTRVAVMSTTVAENMTNAGGVDECAIEDDEGATQF